MLNAVALVEPSLDRLPAYTAALEAGWSPSTVRDISQEQLAAIRQDARSFIADLLQHKPGTLVMPDGVVRERVPTWVFWLWDGAFCGVINLRFRLGTLDLPPHVSGHVGYAVVPWKRRQGVATQALSLLLPVARQLGLPRVLVTCDDDNVPSRRVIEANGGLLAGLAPAQPDGPVKRLYWLQTGG